MQVAVRSRFPSGTEHYQLTTMLLQGAVLFGATIASLSWPAVSTSHWSGPALWYAAILLALASIILAGQQAWLLPKSITTQTAEEYKRKLQSAHRLMLCAWQAPIMCLCYSIVMFLAGLTVVVVSPFATNRIWGDEAKVCSITITTSFSTLSMLMSDLGFCIVSGHSGQRY